MEFWKRQLTKPMANKAMWCRSSSQFGLDPLQNITPTTWVYGRGLGVSMWVPEKSWMVFLGNVRFING